MWGYGLAVIGELILFLMLLRRYIVRRSQRLQTDRLRLAREHYRQADVNLELSAIRQQRDLVNELKEMFQ